MMRAAPPADLGAGKDQAGEGEGDSAAPVEHLDQERHEGELTDDQRAAGSHQLPELAVVQKSRLGVLSALRKDRRDDCGRSVRRLPDP